MVATNETATTTATTSSSSTAETASRLRKLLVEKKSSSTRSSSASSSSDHVRLDASRLDELRRVLTDELKRTGGYSVGKTSTCKCRSSNNNRSNAMIQWYGFLQSCRKELVRQLCARIQNANSSTSHQQQLTSCRTLWGVIASQPTTSSNGQHVMVDSQLLLQFVRALTKCMEQHDDEDDDGFTMVSNKALDHLLQVEWLGPYHDVQYYTMVAIATVAQELYSLSSTGAFTATCDRLVELLWMIPLVESQKDLDAAAAISTNGMGGYLFPPPPQPSVTAKRARQNEHDDDNEDDDTDENDTDEDEENDLDDDDSDDEHEASDKAEKGSLPSPSSNNQRCFAYQSIRKHRAAWTKAWLAVLRLPISERVLHQTLRFIPHHVLPVATRPLRMADFFIQAYSSTTTPLSSNSASTTEQAVLVPTTASASITPLLALEGLFILLTEHGLEYVDFYKQLYKLIHSPSILYVKHRRPFLRLLTKCLMRNDMLPAHVVAAFIKRLMRNSLSASPATILFVLAFCSNLLRKHPETLCLVHRGGVAEKQRVENDGIDNDGASRAAAAAELKDGFDAITDDPEEANALQSSLWELEALQHHYSPSVVTLAQSIGRQEELKTPLHTTDAFLSITYSTLFVQERTTKKTGKRKHETMALAFQKPTTLFTENDVFAGILSIPK